MEFNLDQLLPKWDSSESELFNWFLGSASKQRRENGLHTLRTCITVVLTSRYEPVGERITGCLGWCNLFPHSSQEGTSFPRIWSVMQHTKRQCELKPKVWAWFLGLSWEERGNVLLWEDKYGAELLKQMYKKKWSEGSGFFFTGIPHQISLCNVASQHPSNCELHWPQFVINLVDDPALRKLAEAPVFHGRGLLPPVENFCFKKLSLLDNYFCYPDSVVEVDRQLEESVRLCDTREYCDTLTVAGYILKDGEK